MSGALDKLTSVATGPEPGAADKNSGWVELIGGPVRFFQWLDLKATGR